MSLLFDGENAVGPSPLALLPQKILMWGPTVGVFFFGGAQMEKLHNQVPYRRTH